MRTDPKTLDTLDQIRKALEEVDGRRTAGDISELERASLERSAVALRDAERALISETEVKIVKRLEEASEDLRNFSRELRSEIYKMGRTAQILDRVEHVLRQFLKLADAVTSWNK